MRTARQGIQGKPDVKQMLNDYQTQVNKVSRLEHEGKPIEVADKQKLQSIHDKLIADADFKKLTEGRWSTSSRCAR